MLGLVAPHAFALLLLAAPTPPTTAVPATIATFDLKKFAGTWYEVVHAASSWDYLGKRNAFSRYVPDPSRPRALRVIDEYDRLGGLKHARQYATLQAPDPDRPGELLRQTKRLGFVYNYPFHIFGLDETYTTALVGSPSGDELWILSREPRIEAARLVEMIQALTLYPAYKNIVHRLRCTRQADHMHADCEGALRDLRQMSPVSSVNDYYDYPANLDNKR